MSPFRNLEMFVDVCPGASCVMGRARLTTTLISSPEDQTEQRDVREADAPTPAKPTDFGRLCLHLYTLMTSASTAPELSITCGLTSAREWSNSVRLDGRVFCKSQTDPLAV